MAKFSATQKYALVVGVVVIVAIVFLIISGTFKLGSGDDAPDDPLAVSAEPAEPDEDEADDRPPPAAGRQAMDRAFQFGDLRVIVTDLEISDSVGHEGDETLATERFARVQFSARNSGSAPLLLDGALVLIDANGRSFSPNLAATENAARVDAEYGDALMLHLQPGILTDLVVVFDVPHDGFGFRLRIKGGYVDVELHLDQ